MSRYDSLSKFISLILRHKPDTIGISLDEHGWADVDELIGGIRKTGKHIDIEILKEIVKTDRKGRYSFNEDGTRIRANQGHSIRVDVELKETAPPDVLYHGTAKRFTAGIMEKGICPMSRLYVHLSKDMDTAVNVGRRHGEPAVFRINTKKMKEDGIRFFLSENGVWLTEYVAPEYISMTERMEII